MVTNFLFSFFSRRFEMVKKGRAEFECFRGRLDVRSKAVVVNINKLITAHHAKH